MRRVSLFLTDSQIKQARGLGVKIGAPWASVVRKALDFYLEVLKDGGIAPELLDGRVARSKLNATPPHTKSESAEPKISALSAFRRSAALKALRKNSAAK
jgi:hypothetical protein